MTKELTTFPSIIYSGLWVLKTLGILKKDYSTDNIRIIILLTDVPPAFQLEIKNGDFKVEVLENVTNIEKVEKIESNGYISLLSHVFLGGVEGVLNGLKDGTVKIEGETLKYLGKIGAAF